MNFDPFENFNLNTTDGDKAFKVTLKLFGMMSHLICSSIVMDDSFLLGYSLIKRF